MHARSAVARREQPDPGARESWVQSNTEFHQDWTVDENQGHHVKWKQGVSLGAPEATRRYAPTGARRRRRWWPLGLVMLVIGMSAVLFASDVRRVEDVVQKVERFIRSIVRDAQRG